MLGKGRSVNEAIPAVVIRAGQERTLHHLNRGDQITFREWDVARGCYVFHLLTPGVPASSEVQVAEEWRCEDRGHRFEYGNSCCMECGDTYGR